MIKGLHRVLQKVLVGEFYRRHFLFFAAIGLFLVGMVRPPTFFFSQLFVGYLLESPLALLAVAGLALAYFLKCLWFLQAVIGEETMHFLQVLPARGRAGLWWPMLGVVAAIFAPAGVYLLLVTGYGLVAGKLLSALVMGVLLLTCLLAGTGFLLWRVHRPLQAQGRHRKAQRRSKRKGLPQIHLTYIYLRTLISRHRTAVFVTRSLSLLFVYLMLLGESGGDFHPALRGMALLASAFPQVFLMQTLRKSEKEQLSWLRNLPLPWWKRFLHYQFSLVLLCAPEIILIVLFCLRDGLSPVLLPHFLLVTITFWSLGLAMSFLSQMRDQDYGMLAFSYFTGCFLGFLFGLPFFLMYVPVLLLAATTFRFLLWRSEN